MTLKKTNVIANQVLLDKSLKVNAVGDVGKINNGKINAFASNILLNTMRGAYHVLNIQNSSKINVFVRKIIFGYHAN